MLSNRVSHINVQQRFMVDDDTWPPEQLTSFTPILLVHHQGHRTLDQVTAMAKLMHSGDIGKVAPVNGHQNAKPDSQEQLRKILGTSKATKDIAEILIPLERGNGSF